MVNVTASAAGAATTVGSRMQIGTTTRKIACASQEHGDRAVRSLHRTDSHLINREMLTITNPRPLVTTLTIKN